MKISAVVPIRSGSQRVPNKNIKNFLDTNLLEHKIHILKQINKSLLDEIIINTNCEIAAKIGKKHKLSVHVRDEYYASSNVTNDENWHHLASVTDTENILLAQVTSPFVSLNTYESAIRKFVDNQEHDSLNSVSVEKKFLWNSEGPINYKYDRTPKSQDLPNIFSLNFAISLINKETMLNQKNVVGTKPLFYEINKLGSIDIDDSFDFTFSEILMREYHSLYY